MSRSTRRASKRTGFGSGVAEGVADGVTTGVGDWSFGEAVVAAGVLDTSGGGVTGSGVHPLSRASTAATWTAVRLIR